MISNEMQQALNFKDPDMWINSKTKTMWIKSEGVYGINLPDDYKIKFTFPAYYKIKGGLLHVRRAEEKTEDDATSSK